MRYSIYMRVCVCAPWGLQQPSSSSGWGYSCVCLWEYRATAPHRTHPGSTSRAPRPGQRWDRRVCGAYDHIRPPPHTPPGHRKEWKWVIKKKKTTRLPELTCCEEWESYVSILVFHSFGFTFLACFNTQGLRHFHGWSPPVPLLSFPHPVFVDV